ncbi:MAG: transglycosylase SLT domain-containing protein [Bryobacteraceae bacterium]|jgi:soluble lytic murein transglycosylase
MTIRNCSAKTIPVRWLRLLAALAVAGQPFWAVLSGASASPPKKKAAAPATVAKPHPASGGELATLVRAWRDAPTAARRAAVENYAARHAKDRDGALAYLSLGIVSFEGRDYERAIAALRAAKVPQLADYAAYYLASARVESNDGVAAVKDLEPAHALGLSSPLSARAWIVEARALRASDAGGSARLLRDHYPDLPQPEGDLALADSYQAANDFPRAAEFYQRVYYQRLAGDAAARAAAALLALRGSMGTAFPAPSPQLALRRADLLMESGDYKQARAEYQAVAAQFSGLEGEQARVRMGAAELQNGNLSHACAWLKGLEPSQPEAGAERLYYLEECARRMNEDEDMTAQVQKLGEGYPHSVWRLKALVSSANRYLLANRPDRYVPLYRAVYEGFPGDPAAGVSHWKITFYAWMSDQPGSAALLREHLRDYPAHATAGAALYFLGRSAERENDLGAARACYQKLAAAFQNTYYAMQARERARRTEVAGAPLSEKMRVFLDALALPQPRPVPAQTAPATSARIERSRLLRSAGLGELADSELRFGARVDGQPALEAMELAGAAGATHTAMRLMKSLAPDYLALPLNAAPRQFWELLFPLPYRGELFQNAQALGLDPYLVAGLVRQESEFDPLAVSRARAYGLTQVRPGTGREFARKVGISRFSSRLLYQPSANLKIGSAILRSMLDRQNGKLEPTLAAYNAGPNRATEWLGWYTYREPAEFVEAIPFTETRDYVQAVLRNADVYRRLYGQ